MEPRAKGPGACQPFISVNTRLGLVIVKSKIIATIIGFLAIVIGISAAAMRVLPTVIGAFATSVMGP